MGRRLREAAMVGALLGLGGTEMNAQRPQPQKSEQKAPERNQEKFKKLEQAATEAKRYDGIEEKELSNYLKSTKGSDEEFNLHLKLMDNHRELRRRLGVIADFISADINDPVAKKAEEISLEFNENIQRRRSECEKVDKRYFDIPPPPRNPRPRE